MINKKKFYDTVRLSFFNGKLSQKQVDGMEAILNEWQARGLTDKRQLGYILGTVYWETAKTMQPIEEYGKGKGRKYGRPAANGKVFYGRGFVQLTWDYNYKKLGKLLGYDLYNKPELALNMRIATLILFEGMLTATSAKGDFTGKSLEMYFSKTKEDWVNARRVVNGLDKAELIASYSKRFFSALQ